MSIPKVSLAPFTKEHVKLTFKWVKDPELRRMFLMRGEPTWEVHKTYFERVLADSTQHVYAILSQGVHVGNCGLKNVSLSKKEGELWIYIGDVSMRGKGISRTATELLLREGFNLLGLEMVYVHVAEFNTVAQSLYKRLGFIEVPLLKDANEWTNREGRILRMELRKA
jgi:RimJ/RimL family protein N-acetyltransferase